VIGGVIFYRVHRVVACRTENVLPVICTSDLELCIIVLHLFNGSD